MIALDTADGTITITHGTVDARDGIVGVSNGLGSSSVEEVDFSADIADYYYSGTGGLTITCPTSICVASTTPGQYRSGCGGDSEGSDGTACTNAPSGNYYTGTGGLSNSCTNAVKTCTCNNGVGASGTDCPTDGDPKCTSCDGGHYLSGTVCSACVASTAVGEYLSGCGGTSAGSMTACTNAMPATTTTAS
jgi:hypothetical protein